MFFQKYNPRAKYFDHLIGLMRDTGITDYLMRQVLPYSDIREARQYKEEKLELDHILIPLVAFCCGVVSAIFILIVETASLSKGKGRLAKVTQIMKSLIEK